MRARWSGTAAYASLWRLYCLEYKSLNCPASQQRCLHVALFQLRIIVLLIVGPRCSESSTRARQPTTVQTTLGGTPASSQPKPRRSKKRKGNANGAIERIYAIPRPPAEFGDSTDSSVSEYDAASSDSDIDETALAHVSSAVTTQQSQLQGAHARAGPTKSTKHPSRRSTDTQRRGSSERHEAPALEAHWDAACFGALEPAAVAMRPASAEAGVCARARR